MKRYPVIILAGGEKGPLFETTGYVEKALIPLHGKAMVEHVVDAFHASTRVGDIVVVGSAQLDTLPAMIHARKRLFTGLNVVQNLLHAITYVKHRIYGSTAEHDGYVISFCDAVFLTPTIIDETLAAVESATTADVVLHYVDRAAFELASLPSQRTYIPVGDRQLTGGTIYYVRKFSKIFGLLPQLAQLRKHRKDPQKLLDILGCDGTGLEAIERGLADRFALQIKICISPHPELGMDVDKPSDLELAVKLLAPVE